MNEEVTLDAIRLVVQEEVTMRVGEAEGNLMTAMKNMDDRLDDQIAELRATLDRIDKRDNEDIRALYHEIDKIKARIGMKVEPA
jgi:hypothetical protein